MLALRTLILSLLFLLPSLVRAAERDGATIYREMCANCHGDKGQGSKDYPEPLIGDRSLGQLSHFIDKQMPRAIRTRSTPRTRLRWRSTSTKHFTRPSRKRGINPRGSSSRD